MRRLLKWLVLGLVVVVGLGLRRLVLLPQDRPGPGPRSRRLRSHRQHRRRPGGLGRPRRHVDGQARQRQPDNFVGYRVTEKLFANISDTTATGRTDNVTATMTIDGTTVSDITVTADLRDLTSDNSFRDGRIRSEGLESNKFPEAKFVLTEPITLSAVPTAGRTIKTQATGDFTLHGVTKSVTISLEGRWDGKQVQVVGSLPIVFSDYGITAPTAPAVASVDDHGEMELQLFFNKS